MPAIAWLESVLGTTSKVRILRVLCSRPDRWLTESEIARAIGMSPNTVNLALPDLVRGGAVEMRSLGRFHEVRLRTGSPQMGAVRRLFESERLLLDRLRAAVAPHVGPRYACILFGSAARGDMGASSDIDLLIVAPTRDRAAELDVDITAALRAVHPGPYRAIHLTPAEVRERWDSSLMKAVRHDGILLGGKPLEAFR